MTLFPIQHLSIRALFHVSSPLFHHFLVLAAKTLPPALPCDLDTRVFTSLRDVTVQVIFNLCQITTSQLRTSSHKLRNAFPNQA